MGNSSSSPRWNLETDIPDLTGKVVVVTGGNSGLGFATIQHLVTHGAKVYMASRNEAKAKAAIATLELGKGSVEFWQLDLSDVRQAKKAAETFLEKETRLDILINNAALTVVPYAKTHDDIQDVMMVNHISTFVWTQTLVPLMEKTAKEESTDVRIVNVSSEAVRWLGDVVRYRNREDFNDEHAGWFAAMKRYGRSKLTSILYTKELQRRFDEKKVPILCLSLHPGTINTEGNLNLASRQGWVLGAILTWMSHHLTPSASQGAYTHVFAAVAPDVRAHPDIFGGAFLMPPAEITNAVIKPAEDPELAKELWETTEVLLKEIGVELT